MQRASPNQLHAISNTKDSSLQVTTARLGPSLSIWFSVLMSTNILLDYLKNIPENHSDKKNTESESSFSLIDKYLFTCVFYRGSSNYIRSGSTSKRQD